VAALAWDRFPAADDGVFYDALGRRLAHGLGYSWAWADGTVTAVVHYPVGYPALLAVATRILGERPVSAIVLHAVIGAAGAVCVQVVASRGCGRRAGLWAGLVVALHPALLAYSPAIMTEGVCSALLALPFAVAVVARDERTRGRQWAGAFLAGALLGATSLVRPQALILAPLVAWIVASLPARVRRDGTRLAPGPIPPAWPPIPGPFPGGDGGKGECETPPLLARGPLSPALSPEIGGKGASEARPLLPSVPAGGRPGWGAPMGRLAAAAIVIAGTVAVMAPWAARNERVFGRPVLVSANAGWNLLIGTDAAAKGGWRPLDPPAECREVWDEAAKDACFGQAARRRIAEDPVAWLGLVPAKLAATFDLGGSGPSYLSRSRPDLVPRWVVLALGGVETLFERITVGAALLALGFESGARRRGRRWLGVGSCVFLVIRHAWPAYVGLAGLLVLGDGKKLREQPIRLVTWGVLASTLLTHAVFFGAGRYALPVWPWIAGMAVAALVGTPTKLRTGSAAGRIGG